MNAFSDDADIEVDFAPAVVAATGRDARGKWFDLESSGELYRYYPGRSLVIGPDGTEYDALGWQENWGIDIQSLTA